MRINVIDSLSHNIGYLLHIAVVYVTDPITGRFTAFRVGTGFPWPKTRVTI